jgi:hypothetical protein
MWEPIQTAPETLISNYWTLILLMQNIDNDPANAFPTEWTRFEVEVKGLQGVVNGRFAIQVFFTAPGPGCTVSN